MATNTQEKIVLEIRKMPDGGFIVGDGYSRDGLFTQMLFASTDIGEALSYIRQAMKTPTPE